MTSANFVTTVTPDRVIKLPTNMPIGAEVMVVVMPSLVQLLSDPIRRARFAATRAALATAIESGWKSVDTSSEDFRELVRRARKATH